MLSNWNARYGIFVSELNDCSPRWNSFQSCEPHGCLKPASPPHSLCRRPNKVPNSKRLQRFQPIFPSLCWMCTNKRHSRHSIGSEFIKNVQYSTISPGLSAVTYVTNYDFFQCVVVQKNCKRQREDGLSVWMLQHDESFHNTVRLHSSIRAECEPRSLDVHR